MKTKEEIVLTVNRILEKTDPMGLMALGCPKNEYIPEAKLIADNLIKNDLIVCEPKIVHDVLLKMFDEEFSPEECKNISDEITKELSY